MISKSKNGSIYIDCINPSAKHLSVPLSAMTGLGAM